MSEVPFVKSMLRRRPHSAHFVVFCMSAALAFGQAPAPRVIAGIPNFHVVNDAVLRGGQPTPAGLENLAAAGVKTILDLRNVGETPKYEKDLVERLGMRYVHVPLRGFHTPPEESMSKALAVLNNNAEGPVFVHCKRGADRTGAVVACYRIQHDGLRNDQALTEARQLGMRWYEYQLQNYIRGFQTGSGFRASTLLDRPGNVGRDSVDALRALSSKILGGVF
jgi:protein tyrosine phosphatase (PTP) superfamily phosphohydrolase (DUF442 family)